MKRLKCNSCQKCWYIELEDLQKIGNCPYCGTSIGNEKPRKLKEAKRAEEPEKTESLNSFEELVKLTSLSLESEESKEPVRISKKEHKKKDFLVPLILILIVIAFIWHEQKEYEELVDRLNENSVENSYETTQ